MRLVLVRHGDAHAGFAGVISGERGCRGLTALGRRQAEALRDHLARVERVHADVLLASTLPRAIETAAIIAPALGFETFARECDLCEVHTGEADGLEWAEYGSRYGSFDMESEPERVFAPGGESWNSFHERVERLLRRLAREYAGQTVVAVCHAGVIVASLRVLLGIRETAKARLRPSNTGLTEWAYDPAVDRWELHAFNESVHLLELELAPADDTGEEPDPFSIETAAAAAERGELDAWVSEFLASPGSDNAPLAATLTGSLPYWLGPVLLPLDRLHRLAGPPDAPALVPVAEERWDDRVDDMAERIAGGWEPPPVVVSDQGDHLRLEDGNHRVESLRRAGRTEGWAVVGFATAADRDRFETKPAEVERRR